MNAAGNNETPATPDCLTLRVGDARWAVPAADILGIAEPAGPPAALPHPPAGVAGLVAIEGRAFVVVDPPAAPGAPIRAASAGGALVVVAAGRGGVALRVDAVTRGADAAALVLDDVIPWARGRASAPPAFPRAAPAARAATVPLLMVASGGVTAALPVGRIARVGRVDATQPLREDGTLALVRVDDALLPARRLADTVPAARESGGDDGWAVVVRGEAEDAAALTVDRVLGLEPWDAGRIATVTLPGGETQRWLNRPGAEPVRVLDAGGLFGWPSPVEPPPEHRPPAAVALGREAIVTALAGDLRVALPLDLAERVLESAPPLSPRRRAGAFPVFDAAVALGRRSQPQMGTIVRVRLGGGRSALLSFDRVLALGQPPAPWQAVEPFPPAAGALFDAVCRDQTDTHWLFRLRPADPAHPPPGDLLRCLAAARLGWALLDT